LVCEPAPLTLDGRAVGHGLPARPIPLDALRGLLLHPSVSFETRDAALTWLVGRAQTDGGRWVVGLAGVLLPGIGRRVYPLCRAFPRLAHDLLDLAAHRSALAYKGSLVPGGRYLFVGGSAATLLQVLLVGPLLGRAEGKKLRLLAVRSGAERLGPLVGLCQAGTIATVIDRRYRLREVPEALRFLGEGHAKGKLVAILQ
jgi:hypothetical protein